jgi:hypothetical protein
MGTTWTGIFDNAIAGLDFVAVSNQSKHEVVDFIGADGITVIICRILPGVPIQI